MTVDLAAWLLEQIAEDERAVEDLLRPAEDELLISRRPIHTLIRDDLDPTGAARFRLAECDAKRRITIYHDVILVWPNGTAGAKYYTGSVRRCASCEDVKVLPCPTLRLMALPYADRPGYREEWRP